MVLCYRIPENLPNVLKPMKEHHRNIESAFVAVMFPCLFSLPAVFLHVVGKQVGRYSVHTVENSYDTPSHPPFRGARLTSYAKILESMVS